jgi:hypothetical protein
MVQASGSPSTRENGLWARQQRAGQSGQADETGREAKQYNVQLISFPELYLAGRKVKIFERTLEIMAASRAASL